MTTSAGTVRAIAGAGDAGVFLVLELESTDDTLDALAQIFEWRIGEKVWVIGK